MNEMKRNCAAKCSFFRENRFLVESNQGASDKEFISFKDFVFPLEITHSTSRHLVSQTKDFKK